MNAVVVRHISVKPSVTPAVRSVPKASGPRAVSGLEDGEQESRPRVRLPSGAVRAVQEIRRIPNTGMVEIFTVPDLSDGGVSRSVRVPLNTPIIGFLKT